MWSGLMSGRGSSRGGSALPRSSVRTGFGGGARPGILSLNLRPSLVVSSLGLGSSGSPGIGLMDPGYSSCRRRLLRPLTAPVLLRCRPSGCRGAVARVAALRPKRRGSGLGVLPDVFGGSFRSASEPIAEVPYESSGLVHRVSATAAFLNDGIS
jgi:hypothetical protein